MLVDGDDADEMSEFDKIHEDMVKSQDRRKKFLKKLGVEHGLDSEIPYTTEHDLDIYDESAGFDRAIAKRKPTKKMQSLVQLDADPFLDDDGPTTYDNA